MTNCKVVHVIDSLAGKAAGTSYSVTALVRSLEGLVDARIRTLEIDPDDAVKYKATQHAFSPWSRSLPIRASAGMRHGLEDDAKEGAVLHVHGLWLMSNVYPAWARRSSNRAKVIHSPRGMLGREALRISAWKKQAFWAVLQRSALEAADCLHATAESEYEEIRAAGISKPVAIIPNGVEPPDLAAFPRTQARERSVLSLGRIHPKKGLDRLVRAWAKIEHEFPSWRLRIVGPAELSHDEALRKLADALGLKRVSIEGPIYGDDKIRAYRSADLFVLPTLNENFAMTVAEALAAEIPVISTKGAPWAGLEKEGCGWWIEHGPEALAAALQNAMGMPAESLHAMGARGREWMIRDFSWSRVGRDMADVYHWLKIGGSPPETVRVE